MNHTVVMARLAFAGLSIASIRTHVIADEQPLLGYSAESSHRAAMGKKVPHDFGFGALFDYP
jgi:hypothetical protein